MSYLWVALGGAIGSVLRFWLNNAVTAAFGAAFPWGTLLINIAGSFVISFFGTLTLKASRFAVPPEISLFVMVGLCGGFTTFSSFSLQTVQLARAGEWDRAFYYVAASLGMCILLCWLGVIAALGVAGGQARPVALGEAPGGRSPGAPVNVAGAVLVLLRDARSVPELLDSGQALAQILRRPLAALHVRIDPESTVIPGTEVLTEPASQEIAEGEAARQEAIAARVTAWQARTGSELTFWEVTGGETAQTAQAGRQAAAIVLPLTGDSAQPASPVHAAIFDADCPVLAVPPGRSFHAGGHVAIGWKDVAHARAAILAAMPVIARAARVTVIGIGDGNRLRLDQARIALGPQGAGAAIVNRALGDCPVGAQLLAEAKSAGADTLVLGAARHGRLAEWVLGGVTDSVLASSDIPLFFKQ